MGGRRGIGDIYPNWSYCDAVHNEVDNDGHTQNSIQGALKMIRSSMKIMGLCLAAAFLVSAVAVASASAVGPVFLFSGTAKGFSSKSGAGTLVQKNPTSEANGSEVKCTSDTDTGEIEGATDTDKVTNVLVVFSGCTSTVLTETYTCTTSGQAAGVIKTNQLEGQLGYISESEKTVGLVLKPKSPATLFAEFECEKAGHKISIKVKGEIIGKITPVNELVSAGGHFTLKYKYNATKKWVQEPNELKVLGETKTGLLLESSISNVGEGKFSLSGIETTDEIFVLQSTEIMA